MRMYAMDNLTGGRGFALGRDSFNAFQPHAVIPWSARCVKIAIVVHTCKYLVPVNLYPTVGKLYNKPDNVREILPVSPAES